MQTSAHIDLMGIPGEEAHMNARDKWREIMARSNTQTWRRALTRTFFAAAILTAGGAAAQEAAALQSLKALSSDETAAVAPELSQFGWTEATYLVDGLNYTELMRLRKAIDSYAISLPPNIAGAIRAKTPNEGTSRRNR